MPESSKELKGISSLSATRLTSHIVHFAILSLLFYYPHECVAVITRKDRLFMEILIG